MEKRNSDKVCFGRGFRKVDPSISAVGFNPVVREKEIAVEIDPVSKFCIEITGEDEDRCYRDWETDRKSTRLNSSHITRSRMPSTA